MKTGNCENGRHHTCKGGGTHPGKDAAGKRVRVPYDCQCECHGGEE